MPLIEISPDYGYVVLAATSTFVLAIVHGFNSGNKRKAAGDVPNPIAYASAEQIATSKAHLAFSCAQRAHANYMENQPTVLAALLISGLQYPRTAAVMGFSWVVFRYIYMTGYCDTSKPNGKGRTVGFVPSFLIQSGLIGLTGVTGAQFSGLL